MAASKSASTLVSSTSCAAGTSLTTVTGSPLNLTTAYGAIITAQVTTGTAPTVGCTVTISVSGDGVTYYQWAAGTSGIAASTVYQFSYELPPAVMYAQVTFGGNTGVAVTVAAQAEVLTGI